MASALLFLLPLLLLTTPSAADQAFIQHQCAGSLHKDLCVASLLADPRSEACGDNPCLAQAGVAHAIANASDTRAVAITILDGVPAPPAVQIPPLQQCVEIYANVMTYLNRAIGQLNSGDYVGLERTIEVAKVQAANCEAAFPTKPSPMAQYNEVCISMLEVAWDLVDANVP